MTNEEAIQILKQYLDMDAEVKSEYLEAQRMAIKALEQEPKTGHWEWVQYDSNPNIGNWHCSECRTIIPHMPVETDRTPIYKWCPMCGAKMAESEEQESILDKIKEEIRDNTYFINEINEQEGIDFETVEKIIDKYKAESEEI